MKKGIAIFGKSDIILISRKRKRQTKMKTTTTYIRYYFDRGEWKMTKSRSVLRTGRGLDSAIAAEKELKAEKIPVRFLFIEG